MNSGCIRSGSNSSLYVEQLPAEQSLNKRSLKTVISSIISTILRWIGFQAAQPPAPQEFFVLNLDNDKVFSIYSDYCDEIRQSIENNQYEQNSYIHWLKLEATALVESDCLSDEESNQLILIQKMINGYIHENAMWLTTLDVQQMLYDEMIEQ